MEPRKRALDWRFVLVVIVLFAAWWFIDSPDESLDAKERVVLLDLARRQLTASAAGEGLIEVDATELPSGLRHQASAFVSLSIDDRLRGCMIDAFEPHEPLFHSVLRNTVLAATADERFAPLRPEEVEHVRIAISVISRPQPMEYEDPDDLLDRLEPGIDGVILTAEGARATYLPEVWETFPAPEEFLSRLCEKAGLPAERWRQAPYPTVETYQVFRFDEGESSATRDSN